MARRGYVVPVGLEPGCFKASTALTVIKAVTIVGSIVGTRQDLAESFQFAADGKVHCKVETRPFAQVQSAFDQLSKGTVTGRIVITFD